MKKQFLALTLVSIRCLMAESGIYEPPACIETECCSFANNFDRDISIDVEFLYWYAKETNLPLVAQVQPKLDRTNIFTNDPNPPFISHISEDVIQNIKHFSTQWDPGFRIGLGYNNKCDGWDLNATWTYFMNKTSSRFSSSFEIDNPQEGERGFVNPYVLRTFPGSPIFEVISANWGEYFNQIDLVIGRKCWLTHCFSIRPYTGLRGVWDHTNFSIRGSNGPKSYLSQGNLSRTEFSKNTFNQFQTKQWGVGLVLGIQPNWRFSDRFSLFADFDAALAWGRSDAHNKESYAFNGLTVNLTNPNSATFVGNLKNRYTEHELIMAAFIDLALGFRWEESWRCNQYRTALDLGWEQHVWLNHCYRILTSDIVGLATKIQNDSTQSFSSFREQVSDLIYGGLVARFRFDF